MEIKILDSILHGELKPWKLDTSNTRHFTELVRTAKAVEPITNAELLKQLTALLADYPPLLLSLPKPFGFIIPSCNNLLTGMIR